MGSHRWPTIRYEDLGPLLHTGDVLLFHGASRRSRIIEAATESEFSHIGMIVRPQDGKPPLLWHTNPHAVTEDVVDHAIAEADRTSFPSLLKMMKERLLGHLHIATSGKRMYCAETVALTYQRMGLLPPKPPPNAYAPGDFSEQHMNLRLMRGATLGPQMEVLWTGADSSAAHGPRGLPPLDDVRTPLEQDRGLILHSSGIGRARRA